MRVRLTEQHAPRPDAEMTTSEHACCRSYKQQCVQLRPGQRHGAPPTHRPVLRRGRGRGRDQLGRRCAACGNGVNRGDHGQRAALLRRAVMRLPTAAAHCHASWQADQAVGSVRSCLPCHDDNASFALPAGFTKRWKIQPSRRHARGISAQRIASGLHSCPPPLPSESTAAVSGFAL